MAPESCNLGKDEPEILKPSSPSSSSSSSSSSSFSPPSIPPPSSISPHSSHSQTPEKPETTLPSFTDSSSLSTPEKEPRPPPLFVFRCSTCHKRIGLTGFRCRCGDLFCARHRYSDTHDCSYDYKAAGREEISKANPVIRAAKIIKI